MSRNTNELSSPAPAAIDFFLDTVPPAAFRHGCNYFERGAVHDFSCVQPGLIYAAMVRGGSDYSVLLTFADGGWDATCSCPLGQECKHVVAAFLHLQGLALEGIPGGKKTRKVARAAQPPRSPLYLRLVEHLGRELNQAEADYVRSVQSLYGQANFNGLNESDLAILSRDYRYVYWNTLTLWPSPPADDFYFWLWVAAELRRKNARYPEFIDGVTDLSLIETELKAWERKKQIVHWQNRFDQLKEPARAAERQELELRLAIAPEKARLQWRIGPDAPFVELKQAQAKLLSEQFVHGTLSIASDSLALWSAAYKSWSYESWWSFKYNDSTSRPALKRLLRLPLPPDRVVAQNGQPMERVAEPLRLELRPPEAGEGDYEVRLVTGAGAAPPPFLAVFGGEAPIYLTERQLFTGPPPDLLETSDRVQIPAPAMESQGGLRFLHSAGVPMPAHLADQIKTVPVTVTVSCRLSASYSTETVRITVTAKAPGLAPEAFTAEGWTPQKFNAAKAKAPRGAILVHERASQGHFPRVLQLLGAKFEYPGEWTFRLTKKNVEPLAAWLQGLPPELEILLDSELATLRDAPLSGSVSLDVQESEMDWFDLKVVLNVSDTTLTTEELKLLLNARGGFVRLGDKGWRRLQFNLSPEENEQLARLGLAANELTDEPQRFHALQLADSAAKKFLAPEHVEKIQLRASELKTRVTPDLPAGICAELRPYQTEGFHFLAYLSSNRFGGVLADDMGLGKTLQTLAWLAWLREKATAALPSLVVCPKSVMDNWHSEAERFYASLKVRIWRGEPVEDLSSARQESDLIVMNYAQLRSLSPGIVSMQWEAAILDEAQCVKNPDSQTAQAARALKANNRLALTGTPIENRLLDLWSIFAFAMPGALGNRAHFLRTFNATDDPLARRRLAARVRPFLLRRTKGQVAKDLPDRVEEDLLCEMEGDQLTLYRAELKRARRLLLGIESHQQLNDQRFNILTSLLRLRQICCHPALVDGNLHAAESAKVTALEDLLEPLMEEGHKVLVFSQFVTMLDLLRENVTQHQWPHFYLAGDTENRGDLVKEFQAAKGGAVFLISLKAGGFGLNLTAASYVVLFDPWWNPAVENQAIDRTHRIGQVNKVMAYRLLMRESIEQKIRALQKKKTALMDDVLGEERFSQSLSIDDFRFLFAD